MRKPLVCQIDDIGERTLRFMLGPRIRMNGRFNGHLVETANVFDSLIVGLAPGGTLRKFCLTPCSKAKKFEQCTAMNDGSLDGAVRERRGFAFDHLLSVEVNLNCRHFLPGARVLQRKVTDCDRAHTVLDDRQQLWSGEVHVPSNIEVSGLRGFSLRSARLPGWGYAR